MRYFVARGLSNGLLMQHGDPSARPGKLRFGQFTLDLDRGALFCAGSEIRLRPKSFDVLRYLVERHGQLISQQQLLDGVWGDTVVTEDSVRQCIIEVRKALGDADQKIVRNVPRRGYLFDLPVAIANDAGERGNTEPSSRRNAAWVVGAGTAIVLLGALGAWWLTRDGSNQAGKVAATRPHSIAVLRFADMSAEDDQAYLSDGVSEEILHRLTQSRSLRVIARTSSFAVDGDTIDAIARQLKVSHVLEGSVRRSGDDVRVTVQLVDASTSTHLWSKTYDDKLDNILALERQIAEDVARSLDVTLATPTVEDTTSARAYELFLQGRFFYLRRSPGDLQRAQDLYEKALAIDPEFARAWVGMAAIANLRLYGREERDTDASKSGVLREMHKHAVEQALKYGPTLPEAHMRADVYYYANGDRERALQHFETARRLDPGHWLVRGSLVADAIAKDRIADAVDRMEEIVRLDPLNAVARQNLADVHMFAGRFDDASEQYDWVLELYPALATNDRVMQRFAQAMILQKRPDAAFNLLRSTPAGNRRLQGLALANHALGQEAEATRALADLESRIRGPDDLLSVAEIHAFRGEADESLTWLGRLLPAVSCDTKINLQDVYYSPFLAYLGDDPRWQEWRQTVARSQMSSCSILPQETPSG